LESAFLDVVLVEDDDALGQDVQNSSQLLLLGVTLPLETEELGLGAELRVDGELKDNADKYPDHR